MCIRDRFCNVRAKAADDENLNETLERVFRHIEESAKGSEAENDFAGLFDDYDVNSNKLGATVAKRCLLYTSFVLSCLNLRQQRSRMSRQSTDEARLEQETVLRKFVLITFRRAA